MDSYICLIFPFAGAYAPVGFDFAAGQVLTVGQYQAVFSIVGAIYGGNGTSNFALPNLQGRTLVGTGTLSTQNFIAGQTGGSFTVGPTLGTVTLTTANTPVGAHIHPASFSPTTGTSTISIPAIPADPGTPPSVSVALQGNPAVGATNTLSGTNNIIASSPPGNAGTLMWQSSVGGTPVGLGGVTTTVTPGTPGRSAIPAQNVQVTTVTGGSVAVGANTGGGVSQIPVTGALPVMQPYMALSFIFCMEGLYPMRQ